MNEGGEVRNGTFEWKIDNFMQNTSSNTTSPEFKFGKHNYCQLKIHLYKDFFLNVSLISNSTFDNLNHNAFCKLCVIDSHGKEFLVSKRNRLQCNNCIATLMSITRNELACNKNELLPNDVLTLRLFWCEEETDMTSDTYSEKGPIKLFDTLSDDFSRLYESKKNTDCVLKVSGTEFPVHRAVLSARSEVFAAMFHHDTSENRCGEVDIPDIDKTILSYVLQYLYSGQIHGLSADTAAPMYIAADKYAMIELRRVCLEVLKRSLTIDNVCEAVILAHIHGETDLEEKIVQFIKSRLEEIEKTDQWKNLLQTKPLLAVKLLRSALLADKK